MKWLKRLWRNWTHRRTPEERDLLQVHRLAQEVVRVILSTMGEPILWDTLENLEKNRKEKGGVDYTSLAEMWLKAQDKFRKGANKP